MNVSVVLNNLGFESTALDFIAGFTGKEIEPRGVRAGSASAFSTGLAAKEQVNAVLANKEYE